MNWNIDMYKHTMVALMWLANWKSRSRLRMEPILWWDLVPTDPDGVSSGDEDPVSSSVNDNCFEMKLFAVAGRNWSGLGVCRVSFGLVELLLGGLQSVVGYLVSRAAGLDMVDWCLIRTGSLPGVVGALDSRFCSSGCCCCWGFELSRLRSLFGSKLPQ